MADERTGAIHGAQHQQSSADNGSLVALRVRSVTVRR